MPRVIVLGVGTGVGKTWVSCALLRALGLAGCAVGLKPVESGVSPEQPDATDAHALSFASVPPREARALHSLPLALSPHLAARLAGTEISVSAICQWVSQQETIHAVSCGVNLAHWTVIETTGGVFSPLALGVTNFELGCALEPASWVLVASDSLGALHELTATLEAMHARGRTPDFIVLSQAREADASTGTNAREIELLGIASAVITLGHADQRSIATLVDRLLRRPQPPATPEAD